MTRPRRALLVWFLFPQGCGGGPIELGSDILWKADSETGDLSSWTADDKGGAYAIAQDVSIAVTEQRAHSGRYAIRITDTATGAEGGGGLYREDSLPEEAYYSAWYYVPKQYKTITGWALMRFAARQDETTVYTTIGLTLYSRPGGNFELRVSDYRPQYLQAPLADPPPIVPVGQWFQIEAYFRNTADVRGHIIVWIDGVRRYDLVRPMASVPKLYFAVCGETNALDPPDAELYIDDVAISYRRIGPGGWLTPSP